MISSMLRYRRQSPSRNSDCATKNGNRVRLFSLLAAFAMAGCAMPDMVRNPAAPPPLLQRWAELTSTQAGTTPLGPPVASRITLRRPTSISARDDDVYLIDAGLNRIFHYNRFQQTLTPFTNLAVNANMSIYVAPDRSVYITNPHSSEILHFTPDGTQLPSLASPGKLARPVAVTVDERNGQVVVADGLFDQFIFFSKLGMTLSVVKPQRSLAIAAMATGPDGIYVADRVDRQVSVFGWDGTFRYALGAKDLSAPGAIAVSRDNLVFVSDNFDQTIKVYKGQGTGSGSSIMITKVGGIGAGPGNYNRIDGLAVDGNLLYAIDSLNARVQIMLINR